MIGTWSDGTLWDDGTGWYELLFKLGDSQVAEILLGDLTIKRAWLGDVLLFDNRGALLEEMVWFDGTPVEPGDQMAWFDGTPGTPGVGMTWFDQEAAAGVPTGAAAGHAAVAGTGLALASADGSSAGQATVNAVSDFAILATTVEIGAIEWQCSRIV